MAKRKPKRPNALRIGPHEYEVRWCKSEDLDGHTHGACSSASLLIAVVETDKPSIQAETLIHESLHAIADQAGLELGKREEVVINAFAVGISGLIRDNPRAIEHLEGLLR